MCPVRRGASQAALRQVWAAGEEGCAGSRRSRMRALLEAGRAVPRPDPQENLSAAIASHM
ncbi:hypothetical protein GCM10027194_05160 [Thalassiella azotivora]